MGANLCKSCESEVPDGGGHDLCSKDAPFAEADGGFDCEGSAKLQFLAQVKLFQKLPHEDLPTLASCAEEVVFHVGEVIIRQGDDGHEFFVIKTGEASVVVDGKEVIQLKTGDYFGENALLRDQPRSASIRAISQITALKVARERFEALKLRDKLEFPKRQAVAGPAFEDDAPRPPSPKTEAERELMAAALMKNTNLATMVLLDKSKVNQLVDLAAKEHVPAGKALITEGDLSADYFYIVQSGRFDVVRQDVSTHNAENRMEASDGASHVGEAREGDSFGELALLYFAPRAATVTACVDSVVWAIHRAGFKQVLAKTQREQIAEYRSYLAQVEELSALLEDEQEAVAKVLQEVSFVHNEDFFRQGDPGSDFYILVEGEVSVVKNGEDVQRLRATAERKPCFGEKALVNNAPRAATVTVISEKAKALSLDKATFELFLGPLASIQKRGKRGASMVRVPDLSGVAREQSSKSKGKIRYADLKVLGLLGCGGFGSVDLVEHIPTKNTYALKGLSKGYICKSRMQKNVMSEKTVQLMCDSDFIVKLHETFNTPQTLYFLLEVALGGELYATYNKKSLHGKEPLARFYVGGTLFAFEHLHERKIIFRDLKPENLLLNDKGEVKLTDMGLAKVVVGKTYTTCGTPDYFAPEIITSTGHTAAVDWWTLGVLLFELMAGHTPFESPRPMMIYQKVMKGMQRVSFPSKMKGPCEELVKALCKMDPAERLPMKKGGTENVKKHGWYSSFDWKGLFKHTLPPPYVPKVKSKKDLANFGMRQASAPPSVKYKESESDWDKGFATSE